MIGPETKRVVHEAYRLGYMQARNMKYVTGDQRGLPLAREAFIEAEGREPEPGEVERLTTDVWTVDNPVRGLGVIASDPRPDPGAMYDDSELAASPPLNSDHARAGFFQHEGQKTPP
jgi:hypothetical protein